jgi:hypothetical protein
MPRYKVMVDDNFHYMEEDERWEKGTYETVEEALAVCRAIVEKSVKDQSRPGMSSQQLFELYVAYGDDPFVVVLDGVDDSAKFSAWTYAKELCEVICGKSQ